MTDDGNIVQAAQYLAQRYEARESLDIMLPGFRAHDHRGRLQGAGRLPEHSWAGQGTARRLQDCLHKRRDATSAGHK